MEYINVRRKRASESSEDTVFLTPSFQWLGDRFPGDEGVITNALSQTFLVSLLNKHNPDKYTYSADYKLEQPEKEIAFIIEAMWFHDFDGFIISIKDKEHGNEELELMVSALKASGNFTETTMEQYAADHPEW